MLELQIEGLTKTYPNGVAALQGVELSIPAGMFGLLGPNGAGKSSLMRTIATLQAADAGTIRLGDIDVLEDHDAVRRTLGYLPQEFGLYPKSKAQSLLEHFAVLKGIVRRSERKAVVESLLRQTNLWDARHKAVGTFSGGMRQRFGIAIALIGDPRLIIVDEPTAGLDPAERVRFLNLLSELGQENIVILSTHIVDDVADLCPRMAIMNEGRIKFTGEPDQAKAALDGRIWTTTIERGASFPEDLPVLSTRLAAGRTAVRVLSSASPGDAWVPATPDLEDVYFVAIHDLVA